VERLKRLRPAIIDIHGETIMIRPDFSQAAWRKSSTSAAGNCVEVACADGFIGVRDTKAQGDGPVLVFNEAEWRAFLEGVEGGEFGYERLRGAS
jgi:hypothetical protein